MRIYYDPAVDVLMIYLRDGDYADSDQVAPNVIMDFDDQGAPLAIEIMQARKILQIENTLSLEVPVGMNTAAADSVRRYS